MYYSDEWNDIVPIMLILFRKGGIIPMDRSDDYVYDCKTSGREMGTV